MEREIKFRFWNTKLKRMEDSYWGYMDGMNLEMIFDPESNGGRIPMQFTGLKDNNGVDIYEGDILNIGTVVFERGTFGVYPEYTDEFVPVAEWSSESRQIIGSIHEQKKRPNN